MVVVNALRARQGHALRSPRKAGGGQYAAASAIVVGGEPDVGYFQRGPVLVSLTKACVRLLGRS